MKRTPILLLLSALLVFTSVSLFSCNQAEENNGQSSDNTQQKTEITIVDTVQSTVVKDGKTYNRITFTFSDGSTRVVDVEIPADNDDLGGEGNGETVTPQYKVENNVLYVSYNNGVSWEVLGSVDGEEDAPSTDDPEKPNENDKPDDSEDEENKGQTFENYELTGAITNGYNGTNGIVILMTDNDGGDFETLIRVDEIYRKYGLVGGLGTVAKNLYYDDARTQPKTADIAKWMELLDTGRWKLVCHSMTHKKYASGSGSSFVIDEDRLYEEIVESGELLRSLFPGQRVLTYAMTGNPSSVGVEDWSLREEERKLIEQYYIGGRFGTVGNPVSIDDLDFSSLPYETIYTSSLQSTINKVNACADQGKLFIVFNHYVIEKEALVVLGESSWTSIETMDALCAAVAKRQNDGSLWCAHFEDAVMYLRERETATLAVSLVDGAIRIVLTDGMDDSIYNHDLTVKVNLPEGTEAVKLVQGERVSYTKAFTDANGTYAYLNVKPDGGEAFAYPAAASDLPTEEEEIPAKTPSVFAEELDEVLTFEGTAPLSDYGRLTWAPAEVTATVVIKDGDNAVCINKPQSTPEHPRMNFAATVKNPSANATVLEANMLIEHTSGNTTIQVMLMKDSAISMCRTSFTIEPTTKQLIFNNFNALGESESAVTTAKAGEWFKVRIEYYEGNKNMVKIKTYVNDILVSVSDKYYHANTDYVVSAEQSDMVFVAPNYNFIGKVYVDDISYKQVVKEYVAETVPESGASEYHRFDNVASLMGESIKYTAKYEDSATVTQEKDGDNNYIKFDKVRTDEQPILEFMNTVSADTPNAYVLETKMKLDYTSGSKQVYVVLMCGKANNYAYNCYFNIENDNSLTFYDFNASGVKSGANVTGAKEGEWFDLRIEFYEGDRDTLKIKTYVNDKLVYESSNYYPAYKDGETIIDADSLSSARFMGAWGYVGSISLDDLSVKQTNK